jgi:hypothetical protein
MDKDVARLEQMAFEELRDYVRDRLLGRWSQPAVAWQHGDTPDRFLAYAHDSTDAAFQERLRRAVRELMEAWRPEQRAEYGSRLVSLVGELGVDRGSQILEGLAMRSDLADVPVEGETLGSLALRTLLDFPGQAWRDGFWEPLFEDDRYVDAAFSAFCRRDPDDALEYLPRYLDRAFHAGFRPGLIELRLIVLKHSPQWEDRHWTTLRRIVDGRPPSQRQVLERILSHLNAPSEPLVAVGPAPCRAVWDDPPAEGAAARPLACVA